MRTVPTGGGCLAVAPKGEGGQAKAPARARRSSGGAKVGRARHPPSLAFLGGRASARFCARWGHACDPRGTPRVGRPRLRGASTRATRASGGGAPRALNKVQVLPGAPILSGGASPRRPPHHARSRGPQSPAPPWRRSAAREGGSCGSLGSLVRRARTQRASNKVQVLAGRAKSSHFCKWLPARTLRP